MEEAITSLAFVCTLPALDFVKTAELSNGMEARRLFSRGQTLRASVAMLHQLLEPR